MKGRSVDGATSPWGTARRLRLHLPTGWPWAEAFISALTRPRALAVPP